MGTVLTTTGSERKAAALAPPLLAALAATAVSHVVPLLGPLLLALLLGAVVANTRWSASAHLAGHAAVTRLLLRTGVVLIGLKLPIGDMVGIGVRGIAVIVATVLVTFTATRALGARTDLDPRLVTVLAAGFSICGAAAIAAVNDAVRARQRDVALAVAMVTLFGSGMIVVLPWAARLLGLTAEQSAIWAGASIHEVAQVVAAASLVGPGAIAVATTIKLGRVALLAPAYLLTARETGTRTGPKTETGTGDHPAPLVPWFLAGFMLTFAVRSLGLVPAGALGVTSAATTILLAAGMFGLGLGFRIRDLWPVPRQVLLLALASTATAAGTSLTLTLLLYG